MKNQVPIEFYLALKAVAQALAEESDHKDYDYFAGLLSRHITPVVEELIYYTGCCEEQMSSEQLKAAQDAAQKFLG